MDFLHAQDDLNRRHFFCPYTPMLFSRLVGAKVGHLGPRWKSGWYELQNVGEEDGLSYQQVKTLPFFI